MLLFVLPVSLFGYFDVFKTDSSDETGDFTAAADATGKITLTAAKKAAMAADFKTAMEADITTEAKDDPTNNDNPGGSTAEVTLNLGGFDIKLNLKKGVEYSGADLAKEIANALNNPVAAKDEGGDNNDPTAPAALADDANGGKDWDGKLAGAAVTASFNGSTLTITMDEAPTQKWNVDMTLKFDTGNGNGGEQFKPTVNVEPVDNTQTRQYAQATINMNNVDMKDGFSLQLGNTTYTFAIGSDSRFKNASNVVDLTDLTQKQFTLADNATDAEKAAKDKAIATAINRLSKAAAANSTFYVGSDTKGMISLTEKEGAVDYSVNNLAGKDGVGTAGRGTGKLKDGDLTAADDNHTAAEVDDDNPAADATVADWKGLVKLGQASTTGNGLTLQIGDTSENYNQLVVNIGDIHTKALGIDNIDIGTQAGAQTAVNHIRDAINTVSSIRGTLGATQNRLEHTANNLSVMTENIQDAESTIRDTDIAEEMMAYTKNNILVQSAQAMLAQANQIPQGVLQLLG